jgi:hypothetical protein
MHRRALQFERFEPRLARAADLIVSEVHYNPLPPDSESAFTDAADFEFIEIRNVSTQPKPLAGLSLTAGVSFVFGDLILPPGGFAVVVNNRAAFEERYAAAGAAVIAGEYTGELANAGETITLRDAANNVIQSFFYDNQWHDPTDGLGHSLVAKEPQGNSSNAGLATSWRSSARMHGSPGAADEGLYPGAIVINELWTHQDTAPGDWIELYNTSSASVNLGGWFLSDSLGQRGKYRVPDQVTLPPGGYVVFTQDFHFGPLRNGANGFAFSELGELAVLTAPEGPGGEAYGDLVIFGAVDNNVAIGRHLRADGSTDFTPLLTPTRGGANAAPRIGPIVISELMYNPDAGEEFIELHNPTTQPVRLFDSANPANTWRFTQGITFTFPANVTIPPGGYVLVVDDDPPGFRSANDVPAAIPIFSYEGGGGLDNTGEEIELSRPGAPEPPDSENPGLVPYYRVDRVSYRDRAPWPSQPDGNGPSLLKRSAASYSNDAANWTIGVVDGSPGRGDPDLVGARVAEIRVGGTTWARPAVAVPVGSDTQLDPLPWETIDQVTITFSEPVTIGAGSLRVEGLGGDYPITPDVAPDVLTLTATWTIAGNLAADRLELDLESEAVLDSAGNLLDGDWTDAASQFPSGNGANGGDFRFALNVLPGDVDRNRTVNLADRQAVVGRMFNSIGMSEYLEWADVDGNGKIAIADLVRVRNRMGSSLPDLPAAPASFSYSQLQSAEQREAQVAQPPLRRRVERPLAPPRVDSALAEVRPPVLSKLRAARRPATWE